MYAQSCELSQTLYPLDQTSYIMISIICYYTMPSIHMKALAIPHRLLVSRIHNAVTYTSTTSAKYFTLGDESLLHV